MKNNWNRTSVLSGHSIHSQLQKLKSDLLDWPELFERLAILTNSYSDYHCDQN